MGAEGGGWPKSRDSRLGCCPAGLAPLKLRRRGLADVLPLAPVDAARWKELRLLMPPGVLGLEMSAL